MWGEKFLKAISPSGKRYGAWYDPKKYGDVVFNVPNFFDCVEKMPKDVTYLNWYWSFGKHLDRVYHDNGYKMTFGNFIALSCDSFKERMEWGSGGGFVSNWGSFEDEYMQRNSQYFNLISTAYALFCHGYDDNMREELTQKTFEENYRRNYSGIKNPIEVVHTTDMFVPYREYWCGNLIDDSKYLIGNYVVTYADGTKANLPVKYGKNITYMYLVNKKDSSDIDPDACAGKAYCEVSGSAMPIHTNGKLYCKCMYENPCPEKKISSLEFLPCESKKDVNVELYSCKF
jgi:hexosaminidase